MTPERIGFTSVSACHSSDAVEAHPELVAEVDKAPLRITLDALAFKMIVRNCEIADGRRLGCELLRAFAHTAAVSVAHPSGSTGFSAARVFRNDARTGLAQRPRRSFRSHMLIPAVVRAPMIAVVHAPSIAAVIARTATIGSDVAAL